MRSFLLALSLITALFASGQRISLPAYPFLKGVMRDGSSGVILSPGTIDTRYIPIHENHLSDYPQHLVKWGGRTYILVERTGRVYRLDTLGSDSLTATRIDSTHFYGYNGRAIPIVFRDTLFSFGGEGFWHRNGQLRYYTVTGHEWEVLPLDQEVPGTDMVYHFDPVSGTLYHLQMPYTDAVTATNYKDYRVCKVDFMARTSSVLGSLHDSLSSLFRMSPASYMVNLPEMHGTLYGFNQQNIFFLDFGANKVYRMANADIANLFFGNSDGHHPLNLYYSHGLVHYTTARDPEFQEHVFRLTRQDLTPVTFPVYMKQKNVSMTSWILALLVIAFLLISWFSWRWLRRKRDVNLPETGVESNMVSEHVTTFEYTSVEQALVDMLENAARVKRTVTAAEVNNILGLARKSLEVQKKGRTEAINRINHKFRQQSGVDQDLIIRVRSEEDRRYYLYLINQEIRGLAN